MKAPTASSLVCDKVLEVARSSDYDFRITACPRDPLKYRFEEWVDYYRTKWAIAHVLQPTSILEVGVRYGYSAAAFLNACPHSHYVGIDLDSDTFGGVKGAIKWAEEITLSFNAEFVVGNTQVMKRFPGDAYDLIHIDGQQDGDGSWHDLQVAVEQARWILVDGYFWTEQNFLAISYFLYRYRDVLQFYGVIPGYAGELLIQISQDYFACANRSGIKSTSQEIRGAYGPSYYLTDCGGFDTYKASRGKSLEDERLRSVATVAAIGNPRSVLDLGCGRGELAHFFAQQETRVMAVDYSKAAIQLAEKTFESEPQLREKVDLVCADVCTLPLAGFYDAVVASDLIEHLSAEELEVLYKRISAHLAKNGLFVIHTYPNLWYFQYDYPRRREVAAKIGAYLPTEPRTRYELLMHINEQSPRVLRRSLQRHFSHVFLWFGQPDNPAKSLVEKLSVHELAATRDLYAVASHSPINEEQIKQRFQSWALPQQGLDQISLSIPEVVDRVGVGSEFSITVEISNGSPYVLTGFPPQPVNISYHWIDKCSQATVLFDGERTGVLPPLEPGTKRRFAAHAKAPSQPGNYVLQMTLVQESVRWFDEPPIGIRADVMIFVVESAFN